MKRTLYTLLLLCVAASSYVAAQKGVGQWSSYLAYYETTQVAEAGNCVYAVANGSLYSYGKEDNSLVYYSRQTGLSDGDISHISYNPNVARLLITYSNGNIDLLDESGVYNLSYLLDNSGVTDKTINSVTQYNEYAYLSTNFGIIALNMDKREIKDTYKLNDKVYSVAIDGENIYAATSTLGLIYAPLSSNLLDYNVWKTYPLSSSEIQKGSVSRIGFFGQNLCLLTDKGIHYKGTDGVVKSLLKNSSLKDMTIQNGKLMAYTVSELYIYSSLTDRDVVKAGTVNGVSSLKSEGTYWIAAGTNGIKGVRKSGSGYETIVESTGDNTAYPKRNYNYYMTTYGNKLLVVGGGRWTNRWGRPGTFMEYEDGKWFNFDENTINKNPGANENNQFRRFWDYTGVAIDPKDPTRYFISSYGEGIVELKDKEPVQLYNHTNSELDYILPSSPYNYIRVGGITFDGEGNLWMTNCEVESVLKVLKADGTWKRFRFDGYKNVSMADKITITSNGYKWINSPYGSVRGLFVLNDNGTIDDESDDEYHFYSTFSDTNGTIDVSGYYCVTEDKEGQVWIGTNRGPIICTSYRDINNIRCSRIIRTNDDGESYYLLDGEQINAIAVDGGNRKWIATNSSGVFLVSDDGMETIAHFTTENSPLPSNQINSLAINQITGEVFIGTEKGLVSYMSDATEGSEDYSNVYAYPNPVRPEHGDKVTIMGLMDESNVKITDIRGNIIYQGKSAGGTFTWDCCKKGGRRVATGVYLVLSATPEAKESVVTKIMVVK